MTARGLPRILLDLQSCQNNSRHRGIGRYALALAKALVRLGRFDTSVLLNGAFPDTIAPLRRAFEGLLDDGRILVFNATGPVDELKPENDRRRMTAEILRELMIAQLDPDAVVVTSMVEGSTDESVTSVGWISGRTAVVSVLYDLIPLIDPERYIGWAPARIWYMGKIDALRCSDRLLAISESARNEAIEHLHIAPGRVHNISTAADEEFIGAPVDAAEAAAALRRFGIARPYLMHSGNVEARKNFDGLIAAYGRLSPSLRKRHQLVLVGKCAPDARLQLEAAARTAGLGATDLVLTGQVTDDELRALYAGCHLFVFPSLHEGFGLPALEAMHHGVPTIGSNTTSVPEVIGRADACFDPTSTEAIAALITRCLSDDAFLEALRVHAREQAQRFRWSDVAASAALVIDEAIAERRGHAVAADAAAQAENRAINQIAALPNLPPPGNRDMLAAAVDMAGNAAEVLRSVAHAQVGGLLRWRLEGPFDSSYSLALVNRESARALAAFGHDVSLHSTEGPGDFDPAPDFLTAWPDLARMHARSAAHQPGQVDVRSRNLYPPRVDDMAGGLQVLHQYAWEESGFPPDWADHFNQHLQGITCTSEHVVKVLRDNGVAVPLAAVGNGVDHWDRIEAARGRRFPGKGTRFLHVSSCFPRKGADMMLRAYGDAFSAADDVSLIIKTFANPHNEIHRWIDEQRAGRPGFPDVHVIEEDLDDGALKALYEHCHVLVAPSRAEGFGLPLAEALLSGLPIITTAWSGQLDFCNEEVGWMVDFRLAPAQSHFNLPGSVWAEPDAASLAEAFRRARATAPSDRRAMAQRGRQVLMRHFRWSDVTARAIAAVRRWQVEAERPAPRVGWVTTWNTKCGIASYARHLIEAAGESCTVLAPRQDGLVAADEDFVRRCWLSSKQDNDFQRLEETIAELALDTIILQFNYGFFNLHALSRFLRGQADAGRVVVVMMHATGDPPALALWEENWRLVTAAPGLACCARVLAHTVADLNRLKSLGLVDNSALFPHPLWDLPAATPTPRGDSAALVSTFGYCLPHKGLLEVVEAIALLRARGERVRLQLLNAEYPDPVSAALVAELRQRIRDLQLGEAVELVTEFLSDAQTAQRLGQAALLVFAYQDTQESASGAIRHGLATGKPVLVTPVPIFDEFGEAVYRAADASPEALADAMAAALRSIHAGDATATAAADASQRWRRAHAVRPLARRLANMALGLYRDQHPAMRWVLDGASRMLRSEAGELDGRARRTDGRDGMLMFGPYLPLQAGHHRVTLTGRWWRFPGASTADLRIVCRGATERLASRQLSAAHAPPGDTVSLDFELASECHDLEIQLRVHGRPDVVLQTVEIAAAVVPTRSVVS